MPKFPPAPPEVVAQFEKAIPPFPGSASRKMFGYPVIFVNGNMAAGVFGPQIFVRLGEQERAPLLKKGGVPFGPMPGRPLKDYVVVPEALCANPKALTGWIEKAFTFTATLPPKKAKAKKKR